MKDRTTVYVVEDMAISRIGLEAMLVKNNYEIAGSSAKAETAWDEMQGLAIDIILLDINLAGQKNGIWLAQQIRKYLKIPIVFLTAYGDQKTLKEVLDIKPEGYLMKPYQEPTLMTTIAIALTNSLEKHQEHSALVIKETENDVVHLKVGRTVVKLKTSAILFAKSEGNYVQITLATKRYVIRKKLTSFLEELPKGQFLQCHRRYIVNLKKIDFFGTDAITIQNIEIPTSLKYQNITAEIRSYV